jgi:coiled-coil domain-containing protein 40
MEDHITQV